MSDLENWEPVTFGKVIIPTIVLALTFLIPQWYWREYQYEHAERQYRQAKSHDQPRLLLLVPSHIQAGSEAEDAEHDSVPEKPWWHWVWVTSWVGAIIASVYAVFAGLQWRAIKINADFMLASERAWMVTFAPSMKPILGTQNIIYACNLTNVGRTPCRILEIGVGFYKTTDLNRLPSSPTYPQVISFNKIVVAPNDHLPINRPLRLTEQEWQSIDEGDLFLYGYGFVKYLIFGSGNNHVKETRFCHCSVTVEGRRPYDLPVRPCIEAPSEYHKAT